MSFWRKLGETSCMMYTIQHYGLKKKNNILCVYISCYRGILLNRNNRFLWLYFVYHNIRDSIRNIPSQSILCIHHCTLHEEESNQNAIFSSFGLGVSWLFTRINQYVNQAILNNVANQCCDTLCRSILCCILYN